MNPLWGKGDGGGCREMVREAGITVAATSVPIIVYHGSMGSPHSG